MAADLGVRLNDHGSMVRVVFEWPGGGEMPAHTVRVVDDRTVEVSFDAQANIPVFTPKPTVPEIIDIRRVSEPGTNLKLWVLLAEPLYRRDLQVGQRLILDIEQNAGLRAKAARAAAAAPKVAEKPEEKPVEKVEESRQPPPTQAVEETKKPVPVAETKVQIKEAVAPMPAVPVAKVAAEPVKEQDFVIDPVDPPVLTLASTSAFGVAAFVRYQNLVVVVDTPEFVGTPKFSGKNNNQLPPLNRRVTKDATIFTLSLPRGVKAVRGEGGDLLWRLVLAAPKPENKPLRLERLAEKGQNQVIIPLYDATKILAVDDPKTGETHQVVTVKKSTEYMGPERRFAEFITPFSPIGVVITPLVDDLNVTTGEDKIIIMRPNGLSVTSALDAKSYNTSELEAPPNSQESEKVTAGEVKPDITSNIQQFSSEIGQGLPLFRFDRWAMGGSSALLGNETALIADMAKKKPDERAGGLMNIGKMYLANARGSEAVGYFRLAAESQPGLAETPEFLALRGAAYAVNGQFDLAYEDLRSPSIDMYPDINVWRAYTLANLQDWQQADARLGKDFSWARQYPDTISRSMILTFAEIALRAGKTKEATAVLAQIDPAAGKSDKKTAATSPVITPIVAQYDYLQGEASRQLGKKAEARASWEMLIKSTDDKYRARARLALTVMDYEEGKIKAEQAIDNLEGLRYAWRGDEVEASINSRLGDIYLDHGEYLRGLNALKDASSMVPDTDMGRRITANMTEAFRSMFIGDRMKKIDPLDAITVYEKFSELVPAGPEGNRLTLNLVDRLMEVDLLDRAAKVLQDMVDHRLQGDERVEAALRLAATYLLNRQPQLALTTLNRTGEMFATIGDVATLEKRKRELALLRARAQFQAGQVDSALSTLQALPEDVDVLRARTDVAWQTGRWSDAAIALEKMLALTPVPENKPPTPDQAELVRNLAVATNLSGDRGGISQLRRKYEQAMAQTDMAQEFDVITRARQTPTLADRDTLNRLVSEVDLFGNFLNMYRQSEQKEDAAIKREEKTTLPDTSNANQKQEFVDPANVEAD